MNNNMQGGPPHLHSPSTPHNYSGHHHAGRRQNDYHYPQHPQHFPPPYYPHHQYYGPPQPPYMPQWYPPYQHFPAPPPQPHARQFQPHAPLVVSSHPHAQPILPYPRPHQHTPQPPQSSQTPLADQSTPSTLSQPIASPSTTPTTASFQTTTPPIHHQSTKAPPPPPSTSPPVAEAIYHTPFAAPLPWYSVPESSFPPKSSRRRRRRKPVQPLSDAPEFPSRSPVLLLAQDVQVSVDHNSEATADVLPAADETPASSLAEAAVVQDAPPATPVPGAAPVQRSRAQTRPVIPAIPNIRRRSTNRNIPAGQVPSVQLPIGESVVMAETQQKPEVDAQSATDEGSLAPAPIPKAPPKSWAELLRAKGSGNGGQSAATLASNGTPANGVNSAASGTLADALRLYSVDNADKISFLEPRGLVNTGNMCYMNSILQVLVFCVPFFDFLDQVSKRAVHSFKSNTPLVEAMIMFMREYPVIDSAASVEQLRLRLRDGELEQYGEPFIPEYVYEAIKRLPRFSSMRRGQQQDAEEFLGLLLEVLHVECAGVMVSDEAAAVSSTGSDVTSEHSAQGTGANTDAGGWMEVGHKQKPSVTRSSGGDIESPVTKIFGGKLRSEFRVSGNKNSVTLTPYQQLQLDIGDSSISNVVDALRGLTRPEKIDGVFQSSRGPQNIGTKQFFIESLPPVLILHLKRFHFEGNTTQKIWKKVGYPLELEIPKEVFAQSKQRQYASSPQGLPRYRLIGVVYHHGKNASGGHYTVDVRRQEGREWIRLDDTVIRRVRAEDVAGEGAAEDPQELARALEQHKHDQPTAKQNIYSQAGFADEADGEDAQGERGEQGWSQVNGTATSPPAPTKKWSGVVNGGSGSPSGTGKRTPRETAPRALAAKDNKVAYILFYEQIRG